MERNLFFLCFVEKLSVDKYVSSVVQVLKREKNVYS